MSILNHAAILSDHYRIAPIGAHKESLGRFLADMPRGDCYNGLAYDFCNESARILSDIRGDAEYLLKEDMLILFSAMVADLSNLGIVSKFKNVNHAPEQNRVNYWANINFFAADRILVEDIKVNRFLKKYTVLNDREIDSIGTSFVQSRDPESFMANCIYSAVKDRESIANIYGSGVDKTTMNRGNYKSLYDSCMQGTPETMPEDFAGYGRKTLESWLEIHPCEAYASGDFTLHALINKTTGKPVARVTIASNGSYGPIYATSKIAGDCLTDAIRKAGIAFEANGPKGSFSGLKLLYLKTAENYVATPYLDNSGSNYSYDGESFYLGSNGTDYGSTSGFYPADDIDDESEYLICDHCNDSMTERDSNRTADGDCICDSCRRNYYFMSDESGDLYPDTESVSVYSERGNWITISVSELEDGDYEYCDSAEEYIHLDYMVETVCGTRIFSKSRDCVKLNDQYYLSDSAELKEAELQDEIDSEIAAELLAEQERLAQLLYCQRPIERDESTPDLFAIAA
jgi:hypothetical protein